MASTYLTRTPSSTGNQKTYTFSAWVKRSKISSFQGIISAFYDATGNRYAYFQFNDDDTITFFAGNYSTSTTTQSANKQTSRKFRDVGAWYHLVLAVDTTQGSAADRVKLYVNGVQETWDSGYAYNLDPGTNDIHFFNITTTAMQLGANNAGSHFDGSMAHVHWVDGTQYAASTFALSDSSTGIWTPKTAPSVTYGTNGFFMKFENSGSMGTDSSGNGNNLTVSGTPTQTVDTPSNNFATLNPLFSGTNDGTLSNGNLSYTNTNATWRSALSSLGVTSGKWYFEMKNTANDSASNPRGHFGCVREEDAEEISGSYMTDSTTNGTSVGWDWNSGSVRKNGVIQYTGNTVSVGDICSIALDLDNGYIYFAKNGTWENSGDPTSGASGTGGISLSTSTGKYWFVGNSSYNNSAFTANYGNGYFGSSAVSSAGTSSSGDSSIWEYDCPSNYFGLNTKNINTYG